MIARTAGFAVALLACATACRKHASDRIATATPIIDAMATKWECSANPKQDGDVVSASLTGEKCGLMSAPLRGAGDPNQTSALMLLSELACAGASNWKSLCAADPDLGISVSIGPLTSAKITSTIAADPPKSTYTGFAANTRHLLLAAENSSLASDAEHLITLLYDHGEDRVSAALSTQTASISCHAIAAMSDDDLLGFGAMCMVPVHLTTNGGSNAKSN